MVATPGVRLGMWCFAGTCLLFLYSVQSADLGSSTRDCQKAINIHDHLADSLPTQAIFDMKLLIFCFYWPVHFFDMFKARRAPESLFLLPANIIKRR